MHAILEREDYEDKRLELKIFQFDNSIIHTPSPLPMPSHSGQFGPCPLLKEFSLTVNCCRVSLHLCTCSGGGFTGDVVFLQYTSIEKYASEHYTSMQVCASTQMHQESEHVHK